MKFSDRAFLKGKHIYLRQLCEEDVLGSYPTWFNNEDVCKRNSHHVFPYSDNDALDYIRYSQQTKEDLIVAIVTIKEELHIGNIALQRIHPVFRSADLSIVIGEPSYWGKGYGTEAARLICNHGFLTMNLNRIACQTFENNFGMKKIATSIGMKEEGQRRQAAFRDGKYITIIEYGLTRDEFDLPSS